MPFENVLPANSDTLLTISAMGGFLYQARGLTQTLQPIKQSAQIVRTINGGARDVSNPAFRKYASKISCTDVNPPAFDTLFPGKVVTVHCAVSLAYEAGNPGSPGRSEVSGSAYTEGHFTYYRPLLQMMIMDWNDAFEEWKAGNAWQLDLEEV
jgi:hypothetical protein